MPSRLASIPVFDHSAEANVGRMPPWVRQSLANGSYAETAQVLHGHRLTTVCEEARCPNRGECWGRGTATIMLLGDTCTRACAFCAVKTGRPAGLDTDEPARVVAAVQQMGLAYLVITSVNRDELPDGGARIYAETLAGLRAALPNLGLEVLTPDFRQDQSGAVQALGAAIGDGPLVWGHNVETVPRLYREARKGSRYDRSLALLALAAARPGVETKSALMLGLGEQEAEVLAVLQDLRSAGVQRIALGQYLRPTRHHLPVRAYITPQQFDSYAEAAREMGFAWVKAGAMVRSSYHAEEITTESALA